MRIRNYWHELWKKGLSLLLAVSVVFSLAFATGCGDDGKDNQTQEDVAGTTDETSSENIQENNEDDQAKGRYLETELQLPEEVGRIYDLRSLADGSIGLLDMESGFYVSTDNGQTFTLKEDSFVSELSDVWVSRACLSSDGSIFASYVKSGDDEEDGTESADAEDQDVSITYQYCLIGTDGAFTQVDVKDDGLQEKIMESTAFLSDGTILLSYGSTAYELDPATGEVQVRYEAQKSIVSMREIGNYLYLITHEDIQCFHVETGEETVDQVLTDQVTEILSGKGNGSSDSSYAMLLTEGDTPDAVSLVGAKGLYHHVIGGTVLEEVIKGELSSLSDPLLELQGFLRLTDGSFLIAYTGSLLKHYTYDSEAPAVPEHKLTVYSLEENQGIRMAIVEYHKSHTDTYVVYEVGMTGTDGVTREDAIRNLNTAILSGEGPDVLVLDGLPVNSYMEKGILEDLSSLFENQLKGQEYFENIVSVYKKDGAYLALPVRFQFPVIMGEAKDVDKITDLDSLTDTIKSMRLEEESGSLLGAYSEEGVLRLLYEVCVPAWVEQDGAINKEGLVTFLTKAKEIYEAESKGISQEELATRKEFTEERKEGFTESGWSSQFLNPYIRATDYMEGNNHMVLGFSSRINFDFCILTSVESQLEEEQKIKGFDGQSSSVFLPNTILGVNSQGSSKETASEFVAAVLSEDYQSNDSQTGYPVQRAAFDAFIADTYYGPDNEESDMYGLSWSAKDGSQTGGLEVKWPSADHLENIKKIAEGLTTASVTDDNLKAAVLELAPDALNGTKDVESVANEIINKMQIYLSE